MNRQRICAAGLAGTLALIAIGGPGAPAAVQAATPPGWQVSYKGTGYGFQTQATDGATRDYFQHHHAFSGSATGLAGGWLTFRGAGRFAGDQVIAPDGFEQAKLHTGLLEARVASHLQVQVGRQFLQAGVASLTLDGAALRFTPGDRWDVVGWTGARAPASHAFAAGDLDRDRVLGGRAAWRPRAGWRLGASVAYQERLGVVAARPLGAELLTTALPNIRAIGRVAYDLQAESWSRIQAQLQWRRSPASPTVDLQYIDRTPSVDAASWFARFTALKRIRLARLAVRHEWPSHFGGELEYLGSFVGERTSSRVALAALVPGGRIGYSVRLGDAGEESRFYGELGRRFTRHLWLGAEAAVLTYALLQDAPADQDRDLTSLAARARLDLRPGLRLLAEVQSLDNPVYDRDVRYLVGLDVSLARGASRLGLDRGGWLP